MWAKLFSYQYPSYDHIHIATITLMLLIPSLILRTVLLSLVQLLFLVLCGGVRWSFRIPEGDPKKVSEFMRR